MTNEINPTFLDYLEAFNRKERFFLVAFATGSGVSGKASFRLSDEFRGKLGDAVGLSIPEDALAFMDYHIDWLHAAAVLTRGGTGWPADRIDQAIERVSTGNQEDIDLVVAFADGPANKVVLLEAKAETGWTNKQLDSKVERLRAIFGDDGLKVPGLSATFCLTSPGDTLGLDYTKWPDWTLRNRRHLFLPLPVNSGRRTVFGADASGKPSKDRLFWHVRADD